MDDLPCTVRGREFHKLKSLQGVKKYKIWLDVRPTSTFGRAGFEMPQHIGNLKHLFCFDSDTSFIPPLIFTGSQKCEIWSK